MSRVTGSRPRRGYRAVRWGDRVAPPECPDGGRIYASEHEAMKAREIGDEPFECASCGQWHLRLVKAGKTSR